MKKKKSAFQIAVEKGNPDEVRGEREALLEQVRNRAFALFSQREGHDGSALDDWLRAEHDLILRTDSALTEVDGVFKIRIDVPGYSNGEVHVSALPDAVIVQAKSTHAHDRRDGAVSAHEFEEKTLLQRFDLPHRIDADKVTASLHSGRLDVIAPKQQEHSVS